ncbi:MAG: response regulator, partial [Pseudomonas sp.]
MTADSGEAAWELLNASTSIGLLITDLRMAPSNGLELIRQVRESTRAALPIIIMSGDAEAPDVIDAMHLSVVDFLLKPIDSVKLAKMVKRELGMAQ